MSKPCAAQPGRFAVLKELARTARVAAVLAALVLFAGRGTPVDAQILIDTVIMDSVIGSLATYDTTTVIYSGSMKVYSRVNGRLQFRQELTRNGEPVRGHAAIHGRFIAISTDQSVLVFEKVGSEWVFAQELTIPVDVLGPYPLLGRVGLNIAMTDDLIATGTGFLNEFYGKTTLSVFRRNGVQDNGFAKWETDQHLEPIPGRQYISISLEDDLLLVSTSNWHSAFLYERSPSGWSLRETFPFKYYPISSSVVSLNGGKLYYFDPHLGKLFVYSPSTNPSTLLQEVQTAFVDPYGSSDITIDGDRLFLARSSHDRGYGMMGYEIRNDSLVNAVRLDQPTIDFSDCCSGAEYSGGLLLASENNYLFQYDTTREPFFPKLVYPANGSEDVARIGTILQWDAVEGAAQYRIEVWSPDDSFLPRVSEAVTDSFYTLVLTLYDHRYSWRVKAEVPDGPSEWSEPFTFRTESEPVNGPAWDDRFSSYGPDGPVRAVAVTRNGLVIGGDFEHVGAKRIPFVANWTGFNWIEPEGNLNGPPTMLAKDPRSDDVYFIGNFDRADTIQVNGFARLNRQQKWDNPLPDPIVGKPVAIGFDGLSGGPTRVFYLVTYDEAEGSRLYRYLPDNADLVKDGEWAFADSITSFAAMESEVLIGFDHPSTGRGTPDKCEYYGCVALLRSRVVAALDPSFPADSLDGIQHVQIGQGTGIYGRQPDYIVAGDFAVRSGDKVIRYLARFNGTEWDTVGEPLSGPVRFLGRECDGGCQIKKWTSKQLIYVGLTTEGNIAFWNNSELTIPPGGINGPVYAARDGYFGGSFSEAGGVSSNNLAFLRQPLPVDVDNSDRNEAPVDRVADAPRIESAFPNPVRDVIRVRYVIDRRSNVQIRLVDVLGRLVRQIDTTDLPGSHEIQFGVGDLAAGAYVIVLRANASIDSRTIVVVN